MTPEEVKQRIVEQAIQSADEAGWPGANEYNSVTQAAIISATAEYERSQSEIQSLKDSLAKCEKVLEDRDKEIGELRETLEYRSDLIHDMDKDHQELLAAQSSLLDEMAKALSTMQFAEKETGEEGLLDSKYVSDLLQKHSAQRGDK